MNNTNGFTDQASASTSLYTKEQTKSTNSRNSTTGRPSFFKWFKKNDKSHTSTSFDSRCSTNSIKQLPTSNHNSHETLSPTPSPNFGYISPSSSCDSVISTSTTGFAFINPTNYTPHINNTPHSLITQDCASDTYRSYLERPTTDNDSQALTLRKKYCLYDTDTLTSNEGVYDNYLYAERSLPHIRKKSREGQQSFRSRRRHRRAISDCSKDKKAGAYVHVKGKRKAPPPPPLSNGTIHREISKKTTTNALSPTTTLNRKKRKAPEPPSSRSPIGSLFTENFLDDHEIRAFLGSSHPIEIPTMKGTTNMLVREHQESTAATKLTEQQKQIVIDSIVKSHNELQPEDLNNQLAPPASPISPRPWYKRPISTHRDSSIPFKREIVLKTMEKRKSKNKDSKSSDQAPEVSHSRSSLFDATSKFGFFLRGKDHSDKEKEKRRSGIGIPNISELDREAAEIVNREYATAKTNEKSEKDKFFSQQDHIVLQQQMFGSKGNVAQEENSEEEQQKVISTKDLISKFEASANTSRITLNTSFIGRKENFVDTKEEDKTPSAPTKPRENEIKKETTIEVNETKIGTKMTWSCPFCTLENPNWRIICEVCQRIKPYDKRTNIEEKLKTSTSMTKSDINIKQKDDNLNNNLNDKVIKTDQSADWDKKTEKVLKYFMPRSSQNPLAKSSSETSVSKSFFRKSPSPSRLPIGSPKLGFRTRSSKLEQPDLIKPQSISDMFKPSNTILEEKENLSPTQEQKLPLIDSSAVTTTVTPVFYSTTTVTQNPDVMLKDQKIDLTEVRTARLAKFSPQPQATLSTESIPITDHDSLEREKKRLREMIRAMNAKALAEKYPVLQKSVSTEETITKRSSPSPSKQIPPQSPSLSQDQKRSSCDQSKLGAIKKVFAKNRCSDPPKSTCLDYDQPSKPKKVSTSVQTSGLVKKSLTPEDVEVLESSNRINDNLYANVPIYENSPFGDAKQYVKFSEYDKAKVQEISQQLTSVEGIKDFKATLRNPPGGISATDTLALNKIMRSLELAIADGKDELAAQIAVDLAKMKVSLHVTKQKNRPVSMNEAECITRNIIVDMYVEDKVSSKGPIQLSITPLMTVLQLKQKIFADFEIPITVQRWLINDNLASDDDKTLLQLGVKDSTALFHLYLITSEIKPEKKETNLPPPTILKTILKTNIMQKTTDPKNGLDTNELYGAAALPLPTPRKSKLNPEVGWSCPLCTLVNTNDRYGCLACSESRPITYTNRKLEVAKKDTKENKVQLRSTEKRNDLNKTNPNRKSSDIFNIIVTDVKKPAPQPPIKNEIQITESKIQSNFSSPNITRSKYRGVDNFKPTRSDSDQSSTTSSQSEKLDKSTPAKSHYLELLSLDNADIVANVEPFECPICFMKFDTNEGAILRDCLHTFCRECLSHTVQYSDEAEVKCPYMDAEYSCDSVLQEREIKSIVTKDIYELHLNKSVRVAEHQIENAFHCKTPNCRGWCIYEDNVNQFKCPVCKITNCLTCRVVHDGLTCKQYQDRLNSDCDSNIEARRTKEMLEEMVKKGEAMNCPTCQVVMMKKWGCDWLKCSMCKTEVCWVTRGPRWGPAGKGDTSAGCKCGVDGKKCHPKCNYCH